MLNQIHEKIKGYYVFILILIIWQVVCNLGIYNEFILPPPVKVFTTFVKMIKDNSIYENVYISLKRIIIGFSISSMVAIPLGVIFGSNRRLYEYFKPILEFIRNTPPLALIPMLILWFGIGEKSK
ncbi:MAG: ABC transporter permease, partial [Terrisporobacter sp.]